MATTDVQATQYLTFRLAGDDYAVGVLRVREIIEYAPPTRVPAAPPVIRGVINLRGSVVPVADLAVKFRLGAQPVTKRSCIVIVDARLGDEATVVGLVADAVSQVIDLAPADVEPAPGFGTRARAELLQGLGRVGGRFVMILDLDRVLSRDEMEPAFAASASDEHTDDTPMETSDAA